MPTLHVRNVPEDLHRRIRELAAEEERSLSAETVALLREAVEERGVRSRQKSVLRRLRRHRFRPPDGAPDTTSLLREDRAR